MPRSSSHPTELELEVLKVLWREGPWPVRLVRQALAAAGRDLAYTTVMTVMSIMVRKGYLRRDKQGAGFIYRPRIVRRSTLGKMLRDLVDRAFNGSAAAATLHLLQTSDLNREELRQIQELIARKARKDQLP